MKHLMKACVLAALLCVLSLCAAGENVLTLNAVGPLLSGDETIVLTVSPQAPEGLRLNVFAGEESIASGVNVTGPDTAVVTLTRPLREGETIRVFADVWTGENASTQTETVFAVEGPFGAKLTQLRARADKMWPVWQEQWLDAFLKGEVWLRANFRDLPFVLFPDEAPEMTVREDGDTALIRFSEPLPAGWSVSTATGMPVSLTSCAQGQDASQYTASPGFDSVYLVSPQEAERVSVTIVYQRSDGFLASYPIAEWVQPDAEDPLAFNCYGFGTARSFGGGMYAIVGNGAAWYAEYDARGALSGYTDMVTGYAWDKDQKPTADTVPEGFTPPVVIW